MEGSAEGRRDLERRQLPALDREKEIARQLPRLQLPTPKRHLGVATVFSRTCLRFSEHNQPEVTKVKELGRSRSILVAIVVLACSVTSGRLYAQKDPDPTASIVGVW